FDPGTEPFAAGFCLLAAGFGYREQLGVADGLRCLHEDHPGDLCLLRSEVEVPQVAEQEQSRLFGSAGEFGAFLAQGGEDAGRFCDLVLVQRGAVLAGKRDELLHMAGALLGECVAEVVEVMLGCVPLPHAAKLGGELGLGVPDVFDCLAQFHGCSCTVSWTPSPPAVAGPSAPRGWDAVVAGAGEATAGDSSAQTLGAAAASWRAWVVLVRVWKW